MAIFILIPALNPGHPLVELVRDLAGRRRMPVVIVDDGSGAAARAIFVECARIAGVEILTHPVNRGKGAALKTGIRHVLGAYPDAAIVTADADGQHTAGDIARVAERVAATPGSLVLGTRDFGPSVPWRSRVGNLITRRLVRILVGQSLADTQTGLRGLPPALLPRLLEITSTGYEFELDMLIAAKHQGCPVAEERIHTIYEAGNASSHFNPLVDSMRISFVLLRFGGLSLATAVLDNAVFILAYLSLGNIAISQGLARTVAVLFNYGTARRAVFLSHEPHRMLFPRYILLVIVSGAAAYGLITLLRSAFGLPVVAAKIIAESGLFFVNFAVQRDFVFKHRRSARASAIAAQRRSASST